MFASYKIEKIITLSFYVTHVRLFNPGPPSFRKVYFYLYYCVISSSSLVFSGYSQPCLSLETQHFPQDMSSNMDCWELCTSKKCQTDSTDKTDRLEIIPSAPITIGITVSVVALWVLLISSTSSCCCCYNYNYYYHHYFYYKLLLLLFTSLSITCFFFFFGGGGGRGFFHVKITYTFYVRIIIIIITTTLEDCSTIIVSSVSN